MTRTYFTKNWLFFSIKAFVFCSIIYGGAAFAQLSGSYTINSGAATGGTNFASFTAFASAINTNGVSAAVTVDVVASTGPYNESLTLTVSGTSSNTITINGNGNTISSTGRTINFNGCDYVTIDNLVIRNTGNSTGTRGVWIHNQANYNAVTNSEIVFTALTSTSNSCGYVFFSNSATGRSAGNHGSYNVIDNNYMHGSSNARGPYYGVCDYRSSAYSSTAGGNEFTNNEVRDVYYYYSYWYYCNGYTVDNNEFHTPRSNANYAYWHYGYRGRTTTEQISVSGNEIHDMSGLYVYGLYEYYTSGTSALPFQINDNEVYDCDADYYLYGFRNYQGDNAEMNGNSMHDNTAGYYVYYGFYNYYCDNSEIINNEFYNNAGDYGTLYALYISYNNNHTTAHNTFDIDYDPDYYYYGWYVYYYNNPVNVKVQNNILTIDANPGFGYGYPIYCYYNTDKIDWGGNVYNVTTTGNQYWYGNASLYNSAGAFMTVAQDVTSKVADPGYTNKAGGDIRPTNPAIANMGLQGLATLDIVDSSRTACGPDPGAYEFFVDHSASNLGFAPNSTECGGYTAPISIDVTNGTAVTLSGAEVYYDINGSVTSEVMADVNASSTATHTFTAQPTFNTPGTNTVVVGLGCDDDASNNTATTTFTIVSSPDGGDLTQGSTWGGYWNGGTMADPDITVNGYPIQYDIQSPSKYTDADYGTDWTLTANHMTSGGMTVSSGLTFVAPSAGGQGSITYDPATSLSDSMVYISYVINDLNTGCDSTIGRMVYIPHTPVVDFVENDICLGDVAQFTNTSTLAGNDYMLQSWEFDDPDASVMDDNSTILDGFWEYTTFGTADVSLTVINGVYPLFEYSITKSVTVTPKPEVDFKVFNACEGTAITFQNNTSLPIPGTITYAWNFGDGNTSTASAPSHTYASPGQRQVTLKATANGCDASLTKNAYQFETPTAGFTSTGACNFEEINFTNTSTIENNANMGYSWDFGTGISTVENPTHIFDTHGSKAVELTVVSEFGCTDVTTANITLLESPVADFSWDQACNLTPVNFTNTGSQPNNGDNTSYTWDFNGQGASNSPNPSFLFSKVGAKSVTFTASDLNGCSNSITKELSVVLQAVANFEVADACEGDEAVFTNTSSVAAGNLDYSWSFGDGTTSADHSPTHTYTSPGTISVTLDAIVPGGCSDQITKQINVNPAPDASFTATREGRTVILDAASTGLDIYQWRFGDGSSSTSEDPTYTYDNIEEGSFEICLSTRNALCWSESCETVTINLASVEDLTRDDNMINVYPNPTAGEFNLTIDNPSDDVVVMVTDILGNALPLSLTDNLNGNYVVNLSGIANGVYFVQVKNGDFFATKKITVSK